MWWNRLKNKINPRAHNKRLSNSLAEVTVSNSSLSGLLTASDYGKRTNIIFLYLP